MKKLAAALLVLVVAFVAVVATRPAEFVVSRSKVVAASPAAVYAIVSDFHRWTEFSPWEKRDPAMQKAFSGAAAGKGAEYAWKGNSEVGSGRMTIVEAVAPRRLDLSLEFLAPFAATNQATFEFETAPGGTKVTWSMRGRNGFVSKAFSLVMDMDAMVGGDFEKGLDALASAATR